jgi:uncharacterized protein (DUF2249 family)
MAGRVDGVLEPRQCGTGVARLGCGIVITLAGTLAVSIAFAEPLDVRTVPPPQRHPMIFGAFDALAPGEAIEIVNDHDPVPLYFQFEKTRLGQFDWRYLCAGPELWHVRIERVAQAVPRGDTSGCCGGCTCSGAG